MSEPIAPRILEEAAGWLAQLHSGEAGDADHAACAQWRSLSPEHARAWERAEALMNQLGGLPPALALPLLDRPARRGRRKALATAGAVLAILPAGWLGWRMHAAGHRTGHGERRDVLLADGSRVTLNTASAIDVRFDAAQRLLVLREGEILVQTAPDSAAVHRPLRVASAHGRIEALGTRFTVRAQDGRTSVAVLGGAVRIEPAHGASLTLRAGQQSAFSASAAAAPADAGDGAAWTRGMLLADKMPLASLLAELARYRGGVLRCDPALAALPVSGAFPVGSAAEVERALAMLAATYPLQVQARLGGWWMTLVPAKKHRPG
ncbi:histidine kinase [Massilia violaceinigra]|uniref:Histidine kinase n=1 Tax=Massilia violaceinigra TaxID=2045208 RepID=A0A2D2DK44_9BURK|nr:FecR family protein [Massilia violaceinigra]ATQ75347.1 histidine kinase [Massilia violaceinigra]